MKTEAVSKRGRGRLIRSIGGEFLRAARELAIRRAARDAHRSECEADAVECNICRMHAARIAEAKTALRHDVFP